MRFFVTFCKTRKKFNKYIKINKIKNKTIIDIKDFLDSEGINYNDYKEYVNVLIYAKIKHSLQKNKDIYYIPNLENKEFDLEILFNIKKILKIDTEFNLLLFLDDIKNTIITNSILDNINNFTKSQIIKDY
jgi:hypothetical protein